MPSLCSMLTQCTSLRAPGVPRLVGMGSVPVVSSPLPLRRSNASGQPRSQRASNRSVTVLPPASLGAFNCTPHALPPVHMRSPDRMYLRVPGRTDAIESAPAPAKVAAKSADKPVSPKPAAKKEID